MKTIYVAAAIIHNGNKIFATQRGYGDFKGFWEFPGGKIEQGESPEDALRREILEELDTHIAIEQRVTTIEWDYQQFHLTMHCFWCHVESGSLTLKEHQAARWLTTDELDSVEWLPADKDILSKIKVLLQSLPNKQI
jgi:8-oxo-dGTP diphosphatase